MSAAPAPSRLRTRDLLGVAVVGPRTRRLRSALTATGIAVGIAALVAVMGISASGRADLLARLEALGTNRLEVRAGQALIGAAPALPDHAADAIRRIDGVTTAAATTSVEATVRRTDLVPSAESRGVGVLATETELLPTLDGSVADGRWHDAASERLPTVVLGHRAAERLGMTEAGTRRVWISDGRRGEWFTVIGILSPIPLHPDLDADAFIGRTAAASVFVTDLAPTSVHLEADEDRLAEVRDLVPRMVNPDRPNEVTVSNPSDVLAAEEAVDATLTALLLGLGAVALLVGGIGIANVMVIGVIERRSEIGIRRALGATRRHVRWQFLLEAALLAAIGGALGVLLGTAVTLGWTRREGMVMDVPPTAVAVGLGAALVVGALAGLAPAARAARLSPADAIRPA